MRFRRFLLGILSLACILASAPVAFSQAQSAINGRVVDSSGGAVVGAHVQATNLGTNVVYPTDTNDVGLYNLPALPPASYRVTVEKSGFEKSINPSVELHVADNIALNFTLQVGATTTSVSVEAGAPLVNTETSSLGGLVNDQKMEDLPINGRNYANLSLLQAGVTQNANTGAMGGMTGIVFSSNGAPTISNNFLLDGTSLVNQSGWGSASMAGTTLGMDGIQEYKVVTNAFSAEYGMTMGSQLLMVSKSGTNQFHGDVFEYLRNSDFDARNFFDPKNIPAFHRNNFGGSIGGPIRKDKTFFHGVYEGLKQIQGFTDNDIVPAAACHGPAGAIIWNGQGTSPVAGQAPCTQLGSNPAGSGSNSIIVSPVTAPLMALYPNPVNPANNTFNFPTSSNFIVGFGQVRIDQIFSASDTVFGRYSTDGSGAASPTTSVTAFSGVAFPQSRATAYSLNNFVTLSETHIFSPSLLNSARISVSRTNFGSVGTTVGTLPAGTPTLLAGAPAMGTVTIGGLSGIGTAGPPVAYHIQDIYALSDDVFWTRGKHAFKFGTLMNQYHEPLQVPIRQAGTISYSGLATFLEGIPTSYNGQTPGSNVDRDFLFKTFGFYAQDAWHVGSRLTLNLGLRYEFMTGIGELDGDAYAFRNIAADATTTLGSSIIRDRTHLNFSPRFGFALDVFGNGRTALRGGYGIYYDLANYGGAMTLNADGTPPTVTSSSVSNQGTNAVIAFPLTFTAANLGRAGNMMDYNAYQPHISQYNLSIEQRLPGNMSLNVAYSGSRGAHLWENTEGNPTIPTYVSPSGTPYWATTVPACASSYPTCRVNPNWASLIYATTAGDSWYNGLQAELNKRVSKGLEFQATYTFSHAVDTFESQLLGVDCSATGMDTPTITTLPNIDRGPACFDIRQNFHVNVLYHLPNVGTTNWISKVANGWWISSIVTAQTGLPFSAVAGSNRSQSAILTATTDDDRLNYGTATVAPGQTGPGGVNTTNATFIPYNPNTVITGNPNQWFNPLMFTLQPMVPCPNNAALTCGTLGQTGRGILRGPGLSNWDFSLAKDTALPHLGERGRLEFRAEIFNILNHANFGMPSGIAFSGTASDKGSYSETPLTSAGQITNTATPSRQIQLALKVIF